MLLPKPIAEGIAAGRVTQVFRRWAAPRVKVGGTQRTVAGVIAFDALAEVDEATLTEADAAAAGVASLAALRRLLAPHDGQDGQPVFRIAVSYAGADPRVALRAEADLTPADLQRVLAALARLDRASKIGPWTQGVLELIVAHPARRAPDLAAMQGRETAPFKLDVRKLKNLGLTESLAVGYRIAPRGEAVLAALQGRSGAR